MIKNLTQEELIQKLRLRCVAYLVVAVVATIFAVSFGVCWISLINLIK